MPNFQPQVNYNVPILETRPFREVERPEVNVAPIDISGVARVMASSSEKRVEAAQAQEYENLKKEYAAKYDEIEVALSQGQIDASTADIMKRSFSAESKLRGLLTEDDIKLRKNYGTPIESLDKLRLERIVKEEQQVLENERAHYRTTLPSLEFASNSEIDSLINSNNLLQDNYNYNMSIVNNPYATEAEKEQARTKLTDNVYSQAYFNGSLIATNMMNAASQSNEIDPNFRSKFLEDTATECQRLGILPAQARMIAESIWKSSGAADYYVLHDADVAESTRYAKTMKDNIQESLDLAGARDTYNIAKKYPGAAGIIYLGRQLNGKVPSAAWEAITNGLAEYKSDIIDGKAGPKYVHWNGVEIGAALQGYNIIFKNSDIPNEDKVAVGGGTLKAFNDSTDDVDIKNASKEDLKTFIDNGQKVLDTVDDRAAQNLAQKYEGSNNQRITKLLGDRFNQLAKAKGKVAAAKIVYNIEAPAKGLLTDSIQSDRLRYLPKTGELVLTEDSTIWQDIGNQFNDNKRILDGINNSTKNTLSTEEAINGFKELGIKELQPGENAVDLSGFNFSRAVSRPTDTKVINAAEMTVNRLFPNVSNERRPELVKKVQDIIDPDSFSNAVHKQNMSDEEYRQWYKDSSAKALQRLVEKEQSPFTGEGTTQTNRVSNKSTLSNAFVEARPAVENYESMIQQSAAKYNVDPQYLDMIAAIESRRGNDKRTSTAGAKGIMQFMPKTWKEEVMPNFEGYTEADINDPQKSIEAAAWYLDKCQKFVQTVKPDADPQESAEIQAACYNWGMGKVRNALNSADGNWEKAKRTMPDETKKYVGYVKKYYNARDEFAGGMEADELNANILTEQLWNYIDYDRLPPELKRAYDARQRLHERAVANGRPE